MVAVAVGGPDAERFASGKAIIRRGDNLWTIARRVYVNELTHSDELDEEFFMFRHDYEALFAEAGLHRLESGPIGRQTYYLYGK